MAQALLAGADVLKCIHICMLKWVTGLHRRQEQHSNSQEAGTTHISGIKNLDLVMLLGYYKQYRGLKRNYYI